MEPMATDGSGAPPLCLAQDGSRDAFRGRGGFVPRHGRKHGSRGPRPAPAPGPTRAAALARCAGRAGAPHDTGCRGARGPAVQGEPQRPVPSRLRKIPRGGAEASPRLAEAHVGLSPSHARRRHVGGPDGGPRDYSAGGSERCVERGKNVSRTPIDTSPCARTRERE